MKAWADVGPRERANDSAMVMPEATVSLCPQCGADIRLSRARCQSCGFLLAAAPPPRTRPPMGRPTPRVAGERSSLLLLLGGGGVLVLSLFALGAFVSLRTPAAQIASAPPVPAPVVPLPDAPPRLDPNGLLGEARRKASAWHRDAVLVSLSAGPLDGRGVITEGKVEVAYAKPSGERVSGGATVGTERLLLSSTGGELVGREERRSKSRIAPEPSCSFDDAWAAAQRAGADAQAALGIRYAWSEKYTRAIWEVTSNEGQVLRRVDGVSCSILTR